ncbi:unnamed protein product [Lepeophtheirus salmonis]|uniref:(salmon louse) hypothetical protein n=1 Tax=Lepeophtheirus salmonis TaxID=72036 RepID=A0A7R8CC80_LEPSM|nr:unnamed protein product [Lepeophtheirus salmonis]CAF2767892.1 unnamed protein product [Lepeophtheirus salmonis]
MNHPTRIPGSDKWIMNIDDLKKKYDPNSSESKIARKGPSHLSFIQMTKKLMFSQRIRSNIIGTIKGKFLVESDLPPELVAVIGKELRWEVPDYVNALEKEPKPINTFSSDETQKKHCFRALEEIKCKSNNIYDDFIQRMDELDEGEGIEEIASSGLLTGLKSWLNFGSSVVQNTMADTEQKKIYLMGVIEPGDENNIVKTSKGPAKSDDKLTRKAEERTSRITSEFCAWLRSLPIGDDDSINNTPESQIKALFDTAQSANPNKSKLAEGLKFWAKFGEQATGASLLMNDTRTKPEIKKNKWATVLPKQILRKTNTKDIAYIASSQIAKKKFKKKYKIVKRKRILKQRKIDQELEGSDDDSSSHEEENDRRKSRVKPFDHKKYGTWFTKPEF